MPRHRTASARADRPARRRRAAAASHRAPPALLRAPAGKSNADSAFAHTVAGSSGRCSTAAVARRAARRARRRPAPVPRRRRPAQPGGDAQERGFPGAVGAEHAVVPRPATPSRSTARIALPPAIDLGRRAAPAPTACRSRPAALLDHRQRQVHREGLEQDDRPSASARAKSPLRCLQHDGRRQHARLRPRCCRRPSAPRRPRRSPRRTRPYRRRCSGSRASPRPASSDAAMRARRAPASAAAGRVELLQPPRPTARRRSAAPSPPGR